MNELEILMRAEAKKKSVEEDAISQLKKQEYEKAKKWKRETLDKLSFLKNYGFEFDKGRNSSYGCIYISTNGHGTIQVELSHSYEPTEISCERITKYHLDRLLRINWNYEICGGDKSVSSLEEFVKALVRRGIIKVED